MIEDIVTYYGRQLDKVKEARRNTKSKWGRDWLESVEKRLQRQLEWKLVDETANRSYYIDTRQIEER